MDFKKDDMYRMVVALFAAVQYHRACPPDFFPEFARKVEPFIKGYEGQIISRNGQVTFRQDEFQAMIDADADIALDWMPQLSGGAEYKFRVLAGAALHYFYIVKPVLLANVDLFNREKRKRYAMQLRLRYRAKRVRKELEDFDRRNRRPIEDYYRTIARSAIDTGDTRSLIRIIDHKISLQNQPAP